MIPSHHAIFGAIASIIIFLLFPQIGLLGFLIIFLSSIVLDVDHYFYYIFHKKDLSLKRAYHWFMIDRKNFFDSLSLKDREKFKHELMIFHGIEFWILLVLLLFVHRIFFFIIIGVLIHMILDFIHLYQVKIPFYTKTCQIYNYKRNKGRRVF